MMITAATQIDPPVPKVTTGTQIYSFAAKRCHSFTIQTEELSGRSSSADLRPLQQTEDAWMTSPEMTSADCNGTCKKKTTHSRQKGVKIKGRKKKKPNIMAICLNDTYLNLILTWSRRSVLTLNPVKKKRNN